MNRHDQEEWGSCIGLSHGDRGAAVERLQEFLRWFGYLNLPLPKRLDTDRYADVRDLSRAPLASAGVFDKNTLHALQAFQRRHQLSETGSLDEATVAEVSKPRCAYPEVVRRPPWEDNPWGKTIISFGFVNFWPGLKVMQIREGFNDALWVWADPARLKFKQALDINTYVPDIHVSFIDRPDKYYAGTIPPPYGDMYVSNYYSWSVDAQVPEDKEDLIAVAMHEFGHALGLDDLYEPEEIDAVMYHLVFKGKRRLHPIDIDNIRRIYR
jgi:hypothetical protein